MATPYSEGARLRVNEAQPIVAFSPVVFDVPGRLAPLEIKVTAPVHGERLPIILLSHGHGASKFRPHRTATRRSPSSGPPTLVVIQPPTSTRAPSALRTHPPQGRAHRR